MWYYHLLFVDLQLSLLLEEEAVITLSQDGFSKHESGHLRLILFHSFMELLGWHSREMSYLWYI